MTEFETKVINFALKKATGSELESWVYQHPEIEQEIGSENYLSLISCDFTDANAIVDALNPWFKKRFPHAFLNTDLREMYNSTYSKKHLSYLLDSLK